MVTSHAEVFDRVWLQALKRNTAVLNAFRPVAAALFLTIQLSMGQFTPGTRVLLGYTILAMALFLVAGRSERVERWSAVGIPFFDMPCLFLKQWLDMAPGISTDFRALANFTIGVFILLIMLSAFTLRSNRLLISGGVAVVFETLLQLKAGDVPVGIGGSILALLLAVALCQIAVRQSIANMNNVASHILGRERLQRYFSPDVAALIESSNPGLESGQQFEITVLFSDLRGFTTAAQSVSPAEVVELLNQLHSGLVEQIFTHGGTLDKYIGDGLMAYFGAPVSNVDHASQAFQCARAMLQTMDALNRARASRHEPPLRLSIGLHSGPAVVGAIGAAVRREFTAIGDTVNVAARVERLNRQYDTDLLVSGDTFQRLVSPPLSLVAETQVKGRCAPVRVFALLKEPGPVAEPLED
jgi:adenylate cyclase